MDDFGMAAILISLALNIVVSVLGVIPTFFISGANALVFGLPLGFAVSLIGETIGAYISYKLYNKGIKKIDKESIRRGKWSKSFANSGLWKQFFLLLIARLAPFMPSGVVTFAAAWTKMNVLMFMTATFIGKAPSIAAEVWVGHDVFYFVRSLF